jgi:hypothetical protein
LARRVPPPPPARAAAAARQGRRGADWRRRRGSSGIAQAGATREVRGKRPEGLLIPVCCLPSQALGHLKHEENDSSSVGR